MIEGIFILYAIVSMVVYFVIASFAVMKNGDTGHDISQFARGFSWVMFFFSFLLLIEMVNQLFEGRLS